MMTVHNNHEDTTWLAAITAITAQITRDHEH